MEMSASKYTKFRVTDIYGYSATNSQEEKTFVLNSNELKKLFPDGAPVYYYDEKTVKIPPNANTRNDFLHRYMRLKSILNEMESFRNISMESSTELHDWINDEIRKCTKIIRSNDSFGKKKQIYATHFENIMKLTRKKAHTKKNILDYMNGMYIQCYNNPLHNTKNKAELIWPVLMGITHLKYFVKKVIKPLGNDTTTRFYRSKESSLGNILKTDKTYHPIHFSCVLQRHVWMIHFMPSEPTWKHNDGWSNFELLDKTIDKKKEETEINEKEKKPKKQRKKITKSILPKPKTKSKRKSTNTNSARKSRKTSPQKNTTRRTTRSSSPQKNTTRRSTRSSSPQKNTTRRTTKKSKSKTKYQKSSFDDDYDEDSIEVRSNSENSNDEDYHISSERDLGSDEDNVIDDNDTQSQDENLVSEDEIE